MSNALTRLMLIPRGADSRIRTGAKSTQASVQADVYIGVSVLVAGAVTRAAHDAILTAVDGEYGEPVFRWGNVVDNGSVW